MMTKELRILASCSVLIWLAGCSAGNEAFREARKAELRKDWDTALVDYEKAGRDQPENAKIIIHEKLVRAQGSAAHLKQGERLLKEGHTDEAGAEFQKALTFDPTNEVAASELAKVLAAQAAAKKARESAIKEALKANEEVANPAEVKLKPFPKERLAHFRISADSRKVFDALGKLAGLNVAFAASFHPTTPALSIDLSDVTIEEALNIVALQTHTFWRPITPNTILVVPNDTTNRRDYDVEELKTIYLTNPMAAADRTAISTALKTVLGLRNVIDNPDSNAIIIRDNPENIAAAEQLVHELDRGKAEIVMDVSVVEADRDRARDLGLYPATVSASGTITPGLQTGAVYSPPTVTTSSGTTTTTTGFHLGTNDFALVVPSIAANAVLSDDRTHILQNPQVRATDGMVAKLKIGEKVPYATGSFLPSLTSTSTTTSGTSLLASTQFQFMDVGVILELTPHLLPDGEVAIHASIEISSIAGDVTVAGVSEPEFGERKIEHDIRLQEGETSVLGGLIQSTLTHNVAGVPGLGDIPVLRYLFSTTHDERNDEEVLIMLTPHIVRLPEPIMGGQKATLTGSPRPASPQAMPGNEIPGQPPGEPQ